MNPHTFVHASLMGMKDIAKMIKTCTLGKDSDYLGSQVPAFEQTPIVFCSHICNGYPHVYGNYTGIEFETDAPIVYACPTDSFELMRSGHYLPGHEQFIFRSLEEMLKTYPTIQDFKKTFQNYFKKLNPQEMYPLLSERDAELHFEMDYCLYDKWTPGCNEITFRKPLKIKNPKIFTKGELK